MRFIIAAVVLLSLCLCQDAHAKEQVVFDMNYCCEKAKIVVIGQLRRGRLTVTQHLSSNRLETKTIELRPDAATRLRSAMNKETDDDIDVVAFLNERKQLVLGHASLVGFSNNGVYLVYEQYSVLSGPDEPFPPAVYPDLTRAKFLDATNSAIALTGKRQQIANQPRSAQRAERLLDFLEEQAEWATTFRLPGMWPHHHTRQIAATLSPIHADEEQVILKALRNANTQQRQIRLLTLIAEAPCSARAFKPASEWITPEHASEVRSAAITAIGRLDNYKAVDLIAPMLTLDDADLPLLLVGLCTHGESSDYWVRNPKALSALEQLAKEVSIRHERDKGNADAAIKKPADESLNDPGPAATGGYPLVNAMRSYLHPRLLPLLIEWAESELPESDQVKSVLQQEIDLEFDDENRRPPKEWWKQARNALEKQYDLSDRAGVDAWLDSFQSADLPTKNMLNRLWLFERSIAEDHLLNRAASKTDPKSSVAKSALAELWKYGRLSASCKRSIVESFLKVKLVELDQPGINRGSRELRIVGTSQFRFPENAWVDVGNSIGIDREPQPPRGSMNSLSLNRDNPITLGSMGGGQYPGQPVAKAILVLREYNHQRDRTIWSHQWKLGPIKLKDSTR